MSKKTKKTKNSYPTTVYAKLFADHTGPVLFVDLTDVGYDEGQPVEVAEYVYQGLRKVTQVLHVEEC
jgi:hypothetical protein